MIIYVGNLTENTVKNDLRAAFAAHGSVIRVGIATNRQTGEPRGFGLVEKDQKQRLRAIAAINGTQLGDTSIHVNEATSQMERRNKRRAQ